MQISCFHPKKKFYYVITYEKLKLNKEKSILYPVMKEFQSVLSYYNMIKEKNKL